MDFNLIKKILEKEKAKIVIVENGVPIMIISDLGDYFSQEKNSPEEKINIKKEKEGPAPVFKKEESIFLPKNEELTIDDLPL